MVSFINKSVAFIFVFMGVMFFFMGYSSLQGSKIFGYSFIASTLLWWAVAAYFFFLETMKKQTMMKIMRGFYFGFAILIAGLGIGSLVIGYRAVGGRSVFSYGIMASSLMWLFWSFIMIHPSSPFRKMIDNITKDPLAEGKRLIKIGTKIRTHVVSTEIVPNVKVNFRYPYIVVSVWKDDEGNKHVFKSQYLWFNPERFVKETIDVYVNPRNSKDYWMDITFLVEKQLPELKATA